MESLLLSLNVTVPIFIMMAVGYLLRALKIMDDHFIRQMNQLNFRVFLPLQTFKSLYTTDAASIWNGKLLLLAFFSIVAMFLAGMVFSRLLTKENPKRGTMVSIFFRSNYSYIGVPVAAAICGSADGNISTLVLAISVPLYNVLATIGFEYYRGGKINVGSMILKIIKNPCVIASVLGIIFMVAGVGEFPSFIHKPITTMAGVCTPMALISLGGSLDFKKIRGNTKLLIWGNAIRLLIIPVVFITIAILVGFRGNELAALFALYATPSAMITFAISQIMGGDSDLAAQQIVSQSVLSIVTLFIGVFILNSFGLF